jgi:DNA-directed RNA polymerase subunit RPC12/RpoP
MVMKWACKVCKKQFDIPYTLQGIDYCSFCGSRFILKTVELFDQHEDDETIEKRRQQYANSETVSRTILPVNEEPKI